MRYMAGLQKLKCIVSAALLLLLVLLTTCSGHTILHVKPTPDTSCPADPCLTLSEYAQQPHHYLTSNTTLLLLPGDHVLNVNFTVENLCDFEIHASSSSPHAVKIVCQQLVGFTFRNITHMTLRGLTFTSCGKGATYKYNQTVYGMSIHSGQDAEIASCSFQDSIGTALGVFDSSLDLRGSNSFINNCGKCSGSSCFCAGGGIYTSTSTLVFTGSCTFRNNSAKTGGGFYAQHSTLSFTGNSTFMINSVKGYGGGFCAYYSILYFTGISSFMDNSGTEGGGFYAWDSTLSFTGSSTFMNNSAIQGGGFSAGGYSSLTFTGSSTSMNNCARFHGGGFLTQSNILNVAGISATQNTGMYHESCSSDKLVFMNNLALIYGGAVHTQFSSLCFEGCNIFSGNSAHYNGGGIYSVNSNLKFNGNTDFRSNSGWLKGGGIYGTETKIHFSGNNSFIANTAARGGGEYLKQQSQNLFSRYAALTFAKNSATEYGGAVFVEEPDPTFYCLPDFLFRLGLVGRVCFFEVEESYDIPPHAITENASFVQAFLNIHIHAYNNYAQMAGSSVYGGAIYSCDNYISGVLCEGYDPIHLELGPKNSISSDPFQVLMCEDGTPIGNTSELVRVVYPGEILHLSLVTTGQGNGIVPGVITAFFSNEHGNMSLGQFQDTQKVKNNCTDLYYQLQSSATNHNETLVLYADGPCSTDGRLLNVSLQFLPCPPGFSLNSSERICGCEPRLQKYTTSCNITGRAITREGEYWVGYDDHSQGLILHPHCPFDYCKPASGHVNFPLNNTDLQCVNGRSGLLCGQCQPGHTLALGSSKCMQCSNLYILLLIPIALAGITLVLLLFIFKLTVAAGTINGLIFYANIVTVNRAIFFPPNQTNILTVFMAWLNLDLGIETCFFNGMDVYVKTWLQYAFPLYIWSLVGLIIIVSDYSSKIARLFGSNPVAVLATLFLLSYAKLLRTIIATLFFTFLDYPDGVQVAVWLHDGNIKYFHGKHIVLFLVASVTLLLLFLPYTLLLTTGQWLQAKSNQRFFYWINKPRIKPFLDAYQAPYKVQHRYWTGLMLCLRCALFLVFAFNTQADPSLNLLSIGAVVIGLLTLTHFTGLIYKKMYLDILEISFILNLGILAIATYYVKLAVVPVSQFAVTYISVGVAFTTFVGVLLYHSYQQVWPAMWQKLQQLRQHEERERSNDSSSEEEATVDHEARPLLAPTMTIVEFPNPQLLNGTDTASDNPMKAQPPKTTAFTELREPLDLIDTNDP